MWDDEAFRTVLQVKLWDTLSARKIKFDHIKIGYLGQARVAVFVAKGDQSAVLYDKTREFPSDKLMASLTLLGSP